MIKFRKTIAYFLVIILAGVASYYVSNVGFTYKLQKDKAEAEQEEAEKIASTIKDNYITVVRVGKLHMLRIFNTDQSALTFVLMRPDSDLFSYDEEGNGEDIEKVVNNIQNAYGITVNSYEDFDMESFTDFINSNDSFESDIKHETTFKDINQMTVHIDTGKQSLNGSYAYGVISGDSEAEYESMEDYMENASAVVDGFMDMVFAEPTEDSLKDLSQTIFDNATCNVTMEDVKNYLPLYAELTTDDITILEFDGEVVEDHFEVDIDKAKEQISKITGTETSDESEETEEENTEDTEEEDTEENTEDTESSEE